MLFFFGIIGLLFFTLLYFLKTKNFTVQIFITILSSQIVINGLMLFTWGLNFKDTLYDIELLLFAISSIGLPISYRFLVSLNGQSI